MGSRRCVKRETRPKPWRISAAEGYALLPAEIPPANAGAETKPCRGGVAAPRRPEHTAKVMAHPRCRGVCAASCGDPVDQCRRGDEVVPRGCGCSTTSGAHGQGHGASAPPRGPLLHAEKSLTNAGAEMRLCQGGVAAPRSPDLECRPGEGSAGGSRVSGMKLGRQALNGQVEAQRWAIR